MSLVALRCPTCHAPVAGAPLACDYCGARLHHIAARTLFAVSIDRVGPSNRARVAELLRTATDLDAERAAEVVACAPCEVAAYDDPARAEVVRDALVEAGVVARVHARTATPSVLALRAVRLDSSGADRVAVMKLLREHLGLGLADAKHLVETAPCTLPGALDDAAVDALLSALARAGARARALP